MTEQVLFSIPFDRLEPIMKKWVREAIQEANPAPATEPRQDKPMSVEDLVLYTGYSKGYIYKGTSAREIPHTKPRNGKLCFWKSEIDEWLKSGRRSTKADITKAVNNQLAGQ